MVGPRLLRRAGPDVRLARVGRLVTVSGRHPQLVVDAPQVISAAFVEGPF